MKNIEKVLIVLLTILNLGLLGKYYFYHQKQKEEILVWNSNVLTMEYKVEEISAKHQNKIRIYYPKTDYFALNEKISAEIKARKSSFEKVLEDRKLQANQYYTLFINYDSYSYQNILSYVFYVEEYLGGAHPNTTIFTISYDTKTETFLTIDTLYQTNSNILNVLSTVSREQLSPHKPFSDNKDIYRWMEEGTKPKKENFQHFAFSQDGLIVFFESYQIAPYSEGMFQVTIPYSKLKK